MIGYTITGKEVQTLEDIVLKLDELTALATVCGSAFIAADSFENMNPRAVHESFNNISSQIEHVSGDVSALIDTIHRSRKEGAASD